MERKSVRDALATKVDMTDVEAQQVALSSTVAQIASLREQLILQGESAAAQAEEAHHAALSEQAARYEKQMEARQAQLIGLATEVQRIQSLGAWPGAPDGAADDADEDAPALDAPTAHKILATAIASVDAAGAGPGGG